MVINRLSRLVKSFLPPCLLAISLSVSATDSEFFLQPDLQEVVQVTEPVMAPVLSLPDLNKQELNLKYDNHVTLVHFWASWCLPCRKELPLIEKLQHDYNQQKSFKVITVAADSFKNIKLYVANNNIHSPVLVDQYGKAMREFQVKALPGSYLIDKQGVIRYQARGAVDWDSTSVKNKIDSLL